MFIRFLAAGGIAAAVNLASRFAFNSFLSFQASVVFAYLLGMGLAFWLFSTRVFRLEKSARLRSVVSFVLVNIVGIIQTTFVSNYLNSFLAVDDNQLREFVSHFLGMSLATMTSFFGHRKFTFPNPSPVNQASVATSLNNDQIFGDKNA